VPISARTSGYGACPALSGVSCRVFAALVPAHLSGSTCPTGVDVSACGRSPLSSCPTHRRQHWESWSRQSLATRLNLLVSRTPRTPRPLASRLVVFLGVDIFSAGAPSAGGRTHHPPDHDPRPPKLRSRTDCRGGTAGSSAVPSKSTKVRAARNSRKNRSLLPTSWRYARIAITIDATAAVVCAKAMRSSRLTQTLNLPRQKNRTRMQPQSKNEAERPTR
jgi:hypothetical protein